MDGLLQEWGLECLTDNFRDQGIDLEAAALLNETDIALLIPQLGPRVKFLSKWKNHFKSKPSSTGDDSQVFMDLLTINDDNMKILSVDSRPSTSSSISADDPFLDNILNTGEIATLSTDEVLSSPTRDTPCVSPALKRKKTVLFDVRNILGQTAEGRSVQKIIDETGILDKRHRHSLVVILVGYLIEHHGKYPGAFEKSALAQAVITAFPSLKDPQGGTGYEAFYCRGAHGFPASGYLEEHLRYVRKRTIQTKAKMSASSSDSSVPSGSQMATEDLDEIPKKGTAEYRKAWTQNRDHSVRDVITEFPCLLLEGMISKDYMIFYPESATRLHDMWDALSDHLITYAGNMHPLWQQVLGLKVDLSKLTEEQRKNLGFFLVPIMFEKKKKRGPVDKHPSRITEAFIDCRLESLHMTSYLENIDVNERPQPFVLSLYSEDILKPQQVFTIIEQKAIPAKSLLEAVDTCYKSHYILDCCYQKSMDMTWTFFEKIVYEQRNGSNKTETPALRSFRAFLAFKCKSAI